jgi:hypothetical protein
MNQRKGKTHSAALNDGDKIRLGDLIKFCEAARDDLQKMGEEDSALRFEIFEEWLRNDFRGGKLSYSSKMIGL